jgi:uncharacterized membrane protein
MAGEPTEHALERMVFFSDAVFAIAITLLVIEVHVPHVPHGANDVAYLQALANLIPSFIGFIVSFAVIGMFWAGHHRAFALARRYDGGVVPWNLMLLGTIAFMPFVTAFMSAHQGARVPAVLYWSWLLLTAALNLKVNSFATRPTMVGTDAPEGTPAAIRRRSRSVLLGALLSFAIAWVMPVAAPLGMATIPLWMRLSARRAKGGLIKAGLPREVVDEGVLGSSPGSHPLRQMRTLPHRAQHEDRRPQAGTHPRPAHRRPAPLPTERRWKDGMKWQRR